MSTMAAPVRKSRGGSLALRYALRELRGGLRGFYVFIACIALGVTAIAGVDSVAASLSEGLAREGRTLLGGDVAFSLIQREATPQEVAFLRSRGKVSVAATLRAMARLRVSLTEATVSTIRCGASKSCPVLISASVSLGKHDPPKPGPA